MIMISVLAIALAADQDGKNGRELYMHGPDSQRKAGVPKGRIWNGENVAGGPSLGNGLSH